MQERAKEIRSGFNNGAKTQIIGAQQQDLDAGV
jgi:hypothetical protein